MSRISAEELFRVSDEHDSLHFGYIVKTLGLETMTDYVDMMHPEREQFASMSLEEKAHLIADVTARELEDPDNERTKLLDSYQRALGQFIDRARQLFGAVGGYALGIVLAGSVEVENFTPFSDIAEIKPNNVYGTTQRLSALVVGSGVQIAKSTHTILPGGVTSGRPREIPLLLGDEEVMIGTLAKLDETNKALKSELEL